MAHKPIAISVIIPIAVAVAAILIVPWAALDRSHAQSDIADTIMKIHNDERARRWISGVQVERQPSRRRQELGRPSGDA